MNARVVLPIEHGKAGEVELNESFRGIRIWQAVSDLHIPMGESVAVVDLRGIKLIVERTSEEEKFSFPLPRER